ncbi:MAG TPA: hypothetical protein VLG28_03220 [Acidimicrobiia bacterium]|nr:hypothetical protein [Acidimicrobiia bacterium]
MPWRKWFTGPLWPYFTGRTLLVPFGILSASGRSDLAAGFIGGAVIGMLCSEPKSPSVVNSLDSARSASSESGNWKQGASSRQSATPGGFFKCRLLRCG